MPQPAGSCHRPWIATQGSDPITDNQNGALRCDEGMELCPELLRERIVVCKFLCTGYARG